MKFVGTFDGSPVKEFLTAIERDNLPFATAKALTATAKIAQGAIRQEMSRVFDRPTPFTLNSTFLKSADYRKIRSGAGDYAEVRIKDQDNASSNVPIKWLAPGIYGGARNLKAFEKWLVRYGRMPAGYLLVPGTAMPLDRYGNVSRGELNKIAADLKAQLDVYSNTTDKSRARRRASRSKRATFYFSTYLGTYKSSRVQHLAPGIYQRSEFGFGSSIRPAFLFVKAATYRERLPFHAIAQKVGDTYFTGEFQREMRDAIANYKPRSPRP